METIYEEIIKRKETANYNDIDRARDMLDALLDDDDAGITSYAGDIINQIISLIK